MVKKKTRRKKQSLRMDPEIQVVETNEVYFWRGERERVRESRERRERIERERRERMKREVGERG